MNETLFNFFYGFSHQSVFVDALLVFSAEYLFVVSLFLFLFVLYRHFNDPERNEMFLVLSIGTVGSWLLTQIIKRSVSFPRPFEGVSDITALFSHGGGDSFPSGHTTALVAFATALFVYDKRLGLLAFLVAGVTGAARVAAGVHWPVDILGGALLGALFAVLAFRLIRYLLNRRKNARV